MPLWLTWGLILVVLLLAGDLLSAVLRPRHPVIVLDRRLRIQVKAWPLRILAMVAAMVAAIVRRGYGAGRPDLLIDSITGACLVVSLILVILSWWIARTGRL